MDALNFPLSPRSKRQILHLIFDLDLNQPVLDVAENNHTYFCYYQRCVEKSRVSSVMKSHFQLAKLVALLKTPGETRSSIENYLEGKLHEDESIDHEDIIGDALNLAMRILLMLPTGCFLATGRSITLSGETKLSWSDVTIHDFIKQEFPIQRSITVPVKLEKGFNAMNLERIAGVEVRWTSNLADHLRMRDDDKTLEIFHCATFLQLHLSRWAR